MFVRQREIGDQNLVVFERPGGWGGLLRRGARLAYLRKDHKQAYTAIRTGLAEHFSDDRSEYGASLLGQLPDADIYNLHWVSDFVDYGHFLPAAARRAPLVWTLHDMNPFTGGCHYDEGCARYVSQCGRCPQLNASGEGDLSKRVWKRKNAAYSKIAEGRLHFVAPSRWIADEARRSSLLGARPVTVIPNGLDVTIFKPFDRGMARQFLGLPCDKTIILWAADSLGRRIKGRKLFLEAMEGFRGRQDLLVVTAGRGGAPEDLAVPSMSLGYMADERLMALAYSAADLYVSSSLQESFGYTILESMACGVPVVAFDGSAVPELCRDGVSGTLAPLGDAAGLRAAILRMLADPDELARMASNCRRIAVQEYSLEVYARRYAALYQEVLALALASDKKSDKATSELATVR
jgi:glycosyltransferase involved in cell wall biosynthesis